MSNKTSQHILGTSANLLGFCLFVITSLHLTNNTENNFIDEFASIIALMLTVSSLLSFVSIKVEKYEEKYKLEQWADVFFFISLVGIFTIITAITIHFWLK